jgi:hypothetical protein
MCAAARTERKYFIPRNSIIPDQSAPEVLMSETPYTAPDGGTERAA